MLSFVTGALLGLGFHKPGFLGGYQSLRRRMARLGHIALAALGMLNLLYACGPSVAITATGAGLLMAGGVTMPAVCFLTAWRESFRHAFFVPVLLLMLAAVAAFAAGPWGGAH
ncbi:hypothetical protein IT570_13515 [Candidatus Sumerlaeota bacterium]|nr:hypothetical protein [Candidatus Sumerlaeota bacterium]